MNTTGAFLMPDALDITDDELRSMAAALEMAATGVSLEVARRFVNQELVDYLRGQIGASAIQGQPALFDTLIGQLTGPPNPRSIAAAQDIARRQAETLATNLVASDLKAIGQTVARGIEEGKNFKAIARNLDMVKGLDPARASRMDKYRAFLDSSDPALSKVEWERRFESRYQKELAARRRTIAQTEQRIATSEGNKLLAEERGVQFQSWITAGDAQVDEHCEGNEAQGWIGFGDAFQSGSVQPPEHPNCRCTVAYRTAAPNEQAEARAVRRTERTATAKAEGVAA